LPSEADIAADGKWTQARLLPTAGIRGQAEQENRATSALLAVIAAVPSFARALLKPVGIPGGKVSTYTEVRLKDRAGKVHIPDGAIVVAKGSSRYCYLLEVKTSTAVLEAEQVTRYLEMARRNGFDGVLTISNQIVADSDARPFKLAGNKIGKLKVAHLSWWQILTEAVIQHRFRGVDDPDQAWILGELIRYLTDERSGASGFEGLGPNWVRVRDGARNGTLRASDPEAAEVSARWEQMIEYLCLSLSQELGVAVRRQRSRGKSPSERLNEAVRLLAEEGLMRSALRVPEAVGPIEILADLGAGRLTTSVEVEAPRDLKRPTARINWLLRQLKDAPDDLRLEVRFARRRESRSELLGDCRADSACLLLPDDPRRDPILFTIAKAQKMGRKGGRGEGTFVTETSKQAISFYRDLVQDLRAPQPKAPQIVEEEKPAPEPEQSEGQARREVDSSFRSIAEILGRT
jgi:hypothetical protein